ncbi:MAG: hypothetical protein WB441_03345, partial [Nocardioidaceae bacterium]
MVLTGALARIAVARAHVVVVEQPGCLDLRLAADRAVRERGWVPADSPADGDVLLVCGGPVAATEDAVAAVWDALPGPRVRCEVTHEGQLAEALERAGDRLRDTAAHRTDPHGRRAGEPEPDHGDMDHGDMDHGDMDHGDMDHGDMDHGDMDHGDMEMAPGGIPLAEGADDRDGLEMDVLRLPLGPVLPHWPSGLVLHCTLHGDVVMQATVEDLGVGSGRPASPATVAARHSDLVVDLLALAGWGSGADLARRARDAALDGDTTTAERLLVRLRTRTRRSRVLRWMLRGLGTLDPADVDPTAGRRLPDHLVGDVHQRLLALVDRAVAAVRGELVAV